MKFLKSQWFTLCFALLALVLVIINMVQGDDLMTIAWTISFVYWVVSASTMYNDERIKALEREVEEIKNRAITDVEETSPNHYTCMRRLGPDKNVKDFGGKK